MSIASITTTSSQNMDSSLLQQAGVMSRKDAEARLASLSPETKEHAQLWSALHKTSGIAEIQIGGGSSYKVSTQCDHLLGGFGSAEHYDIGRQVELEGVEGGIVFQSGDASLQFAHILTLAGDFYAVVNQPISLLGGTDQDKEGRFLAAFATLERANAQQLKRLAVGIEEECHEVKNSAAPHHCYSSRLISSNNRFKAIKNDVDALLVDNSDHFAEHARDAYLIGHGLACKEAAKAGLSDDQEGLKRAYALEAFACHFLTDLFAAGHIRNQRGALEIFLNKTLGFSESCAKSLSGVLTGAQHEFDGRRGLNVFNEAGEQWRSYGDGFFFTPANNVNQQRTIEALQQSVDEVKDAYLGKKVEPTKMGERIPTADPANNHLPLYRIEGNKLFVYQGGKSDNGDRGTPIESKVDYITMAVPLALSELPESYVNGFINAYITPFKLTLPREVDDILGLVNKIIMPRLERLTDKVWHIVGVASQYQLRVASERQAALTEELMRTANETHKQGLEILEQIRQLDQKMENMHYDLRTAPITNNITTIQSNFLSLRKYDVLGEDQKILIRNALHDSAYTLINIFYNPGNPGHRSTQSPLTAYADIQFPKASSDRKKLEATRWFRQILDYQCAALATYLDLKYQSPNEQNNLIREVASIEALFREQVQANRDLVMIEALFSSRDYMNLTQQKIEMQQNFLEFIQGGES